MSIILLSGATGEIGGQIAAQLAASATVGRFILLGRNEIRMGALAASLPGDKAEFEKVDLWKTCVEDVEACSTRLLQKLPRVDALIDNAATVPWLPHGDGGWARGAVLHRYAQLFRADDPASAAARHQPQRARDQRSIRLSRRAGPVRPAVGAP
eukprot:COSAG05_NODE_9072_length_649_cov_1.505455_1_plen_153_part_10